MNKQELRSHMSKKRNDLSWLDVQGKSHEISQWLVNLEQFHTSKTILFYLPINKEPDTKGIIHTAWQLKKEVVVPVSQPADKTLLLSRIESMNELTEGHFHVLEPKEEFLRPVDPSTVDMCILPGLAFDRSGYRLGYGAGYYDRFLPLLRSDCLKITLGYEVQVTESVPHESHDIPVNLIVTEKGVHHCHKANT